MGLSLSVEKCVLCSNYPESNLDLPPKQANVADCLPGVDGDPAFRLKKYSIDCREYLGFAPSDQKIKISCQAQFEVSDDKTAGKTAIIRIEWVLLPYLTKLKYTVRRNTLVYFCRSEGEEKLLRFQSCGW